MRGQSMLGTAAKLADVARPKLAKLLVVSRKMMRITSKPSYEISLSKNSLRMEIPKRGLPKTVSTGNKFVGRTKKGKSYLAEY